MYQFLVLHSLSMNQTLGLRLHDVTEPPGKIKCVMVKNMFCQCSLLNPTRSLSTEANHLGFTKPSSCLLLFCNILLEAAWLHHNRNSSGNSNGIFMHPNDWRQLVVPGGLCVAQYKASERGQMIFYEGVKVFISKHLLEQVFGLEFVTC